MNLAQFTGTEYYYKWSPLFRNFVLTDGTKHLAEEAGAYWLMDAIASHFRSYRGEDFVVATLKKRPQTWLLKLTDGNYVKLASQVIEYSDFPLDEITLYVIKQDDLRVVLLPSEY